MRHRWLRRASGWVDESVSAGLPRVLTAANTLFHAAAARSRGLATQAVKGVDDSKAWKPLRRAALGSGASRTAETLDDMLRPIVVGLPNGLPTCVAVGLRVWRYVAACTRSCAIRGMHGLAMESSRPIPGRLHSSKSITPGGGYVARPEGRGNARGADHGAAACRPVDSVPWNRAP